MHLQFIDAITRIRVSRIYVTIRMWNVKLEIRSQVNMEFLRLRLTYIFPVYDSLIYALKHRIKTDATSV